MDHDQIQTAVEFIESNADVIREALRRARVTKPWFTYGRDTEMRGELTSLDGSTIAEVRWDGEAFTCVDPDIRIEFPAMPDDSESDTEDVLQNIFNDCVQRASNILSERGWVILGREIINPCPRCGRDVAHKAGEMCVNCKAGRHAWGVGGCLICGLQRRGKKRGEPAVYRTGPAEPWGPNQPCKEA